MKGSAARRGPERREHGAALLLFLLVLVMLSAGQLLRRLNEQATTRYAADRLARSGAALAEAKRALLGAAVAYSRPALTPPRGPGRLSCASTSTGTGSVPEVQPGDCFSGGAVSFGLLPRSIDDETRPPLPPIRDADDSPLVYLMDNRFRKGGTDPVHLGYTPVLRLNGQPVVALIFAPGAATGGQERLGAGQVVSVEVYLEDPENIDGDMDYVTPVVADGNDAVVAITRDDILCAIRPLVRVALDKWRANAADPTIPTWFKPPDGSEGDGWLSMVPGDPSGRNRAEQLDETVLLCGWTPLL